MMRLACLFLSLMMIAGPAWTAEPDEILDDPALEERARAISKGLRCLVCQNESIDESNAPLAKDLRLLVRERLVAGDTDGEVTAFVVSRYGDFVLLKPPVKPSTYLLWAGPFMLLLLGGVGAAVFIRASRLAPAATGEALSDEDERRLKTLLSQDDDG
ncbi:MAG: cytochrome c-type biogenesis protein [Pseudomonadota bacterium]